MSTTAPVKPSNELLPSQFQVVVADCFYDKLDTPSNQEFFGKIFNFKIKSYLKEYPFGILPVGAHDVVGTHLLLCEKLQNELVPIVGFKGITYDRCKKFNLPFPALDALSSDPNASTQLATTQIFIMDVLKKNQNLGYIGSWTIDPSVRNNPERSKFAKDITTAFVSLWCEHWKVDQLLTFAATRFKVEAYHQYLGLEPLKDSLGNSLAPVKIKFAFDEPTTLSIIGSSGISQKARLMAKRYLDLWENRIEIGRESLDEMQSAA